jgi:CubicO group peptidase (beta-lactamase class C family)
MHFQRDYWPTQAWRLSPPQEQGLNPEFVPRLEAYLATLARPALDALLIVRHGYLVYERFAGNYTAESYMQLHSVTKSVISTLVGLALRDGLLRDLDQRWEELLPAYFDAATEPRKRQITLRHLLKMTSGLNPDYLAYPGRRGDTSEDWARFAVETPAILDPDQLFLYCSLGSHLLSKILTTVAGMSTLEYARHALFAPLGIASDEERGFAWETDPRGYFVGGAGLWLRAHDAAKLGLLYASGGQWEGRQLLPADYLREATREQSPGGHPEATAYGYHWWVGELGGQRYHYAAGFGGQYIQVFPELDLLIVILAPDAPSPGVYNRDLIPQAFVLPAIQE